MARATKWVVAGNVTTTKPPSPKKQRFAPKNKLLHKKDPTIKVMGFDDPIAIEVYDYILSDTKPGFINNFRKWSKDEIECEELTVANFIGLKIQRNNDIDGNETLSGDDGYSCWWMI